MTYKKCDRAIVFYSNAEYCDHAAKLTVKLREKKIRIEIWSSGREDIIIKTKSYFTKREAWKQFRLQIANSILGGWKIMNALPKRETWETKRSK